MSSYADMDLFWLPTPQNTEVKIPLFHRTAKYPRLSTSRIPARIFWQPGHVPLWRHVDTLSSQMNVLSLVSRLAPQDPPRQYSLWDVERLEKAAFVRPANHSKLSCMLAKALRSLTSQRMSCGGINLSPRFPIRTSDSLPNAALHNKSETYFTYSLKKTEVTRLSNAWLSKMVVITILQHAIFPRFYFVSRLSYTYTGIIICIYFLLL